VTKFYAVNPVSAICSDKLQVPPVSAEPTYPWLSSASPSDPPKKLMANSTLLDLKENVSIEFFPGQQ
jgi:hypothetical protein